MNRELLEIIKDYATRSHAEVRKALLEKSKDNLIVRLTELLTLYFNDVNSSTLREIVVAVSSGYTPTSTKLGYNGYRQNALSGKPEHCEIKPKNIITGKGGKLNGGGNFTDYTWKRLEKHQNENPNMLVAGFVDGRLVYIFSFPFNTASFVERLTQQLHRHFPDGDESGKYLRGASFTLKDYEGGTDFEAKCFVSARHLDKLRGQLTDKIYHLLEGFRS